MSTSGSGVETWADGLDTATVDYDGVYEKERHMFRLAAMAEKPIAVDIEKGLGLC